MTRLRRDHVEIAHEMRERSMPVQIERDGVYSGSVIRFTPLTNWRGQVQGAALAPGSGTVPSVWPAARLTLDGLPAETDPNYFWLGSLTTGMTDGSGLQYRRNRYYDPETGRFTQSDPIGLAGGMNLYGFAGSDPVNFTDPFGLCPEPADKDGTVCVALFIQSESALGLKGDGRGFSSSSDPSQSRVFVHIDVANQTFSATSNPTCTTGGRCADPLSSNEVGVAFGADGGFTVSVNAKNSVMPGPAINGSFSFTSDGRGGFTTSGNRDAFPSAEAYLWRGGQPTTLFQRPERTPFHLLPFMRNDRWPR